MADHDRRGTRPDLDALLDALPAEISARVRAIPAERDVIEIVMDLGRRPEARFGGGGEEVLLEREITDADLQHVVASIGSFGEDNRAGIERTLHRISAIRNRSGRIVGLTCRIGRAVFGTIEIIADLVESGKSVLIMGRPGIGKTTMLREAARVLADDLDKRVVVVDTSNEIAGDGDIPHPGIGRARRMQVRTPALQHAVMIEAVENHMPQVIVIDEIGTEQEAGAARTIAERGVQLIGTAHGNSLDNLLVNPTLSDLIGGIQSVTLGDDEARRRGTQKSVLERKAPPTFDVVVELVDRDRVIVHADVAETVDAILRGDPLAPELRWRDELGVHRSQVRQQAGPTRQLPGERFGGLVGNAGGSGWAPGRFGEPGRGDPGIRDGGRGGSRPGFRPGTGGGWRESRGGRPGRPGRGPGAAPWESEPPRAGQAGFRAAGFVAGGIADRGPLERSASPLPEARPGDARELARQAAWRVSAERALAALASAGSVIDDAPPEGADAPLRDEDRPIVRLSDGLGEAPVPLDTIHLWPWGVSRKRLEQAVRELGLPVVVVREPEEADAVITLRSVYKQKAPGLREAEQRGLPVYVVKTNTQPQMESVLTSLYSLDVTPDEAALREVEEAIGIARAEARPVELSPQNAYVRRLQHQAADRANLVSHSAGQEPHRRVRIYPEPVRQGRR